MRRLRVEGKLLRVRAEPEAEVPGRLPVVCIHGAGMSSVIWMDALRRLAPALRVLAPDLPGHGQSEADPAAAISIDGYRDAVLALLTQTETQTHAQPNIGRAVLVGHSMGAAIALRCALSRPERVAALVLVNGAARLRVSGEVLALLERTLPAGPPAFADRMPAEFGDLCFSPRTLPDLRARWQAMLFCARRDVVLGDFLACDGFDVRGELPRLHVPTLLFAGSDDLLVPPRLAQEAAGLIPGARLVVVEGTGHLTHIEAPDLFYRSLLPFLQRMC